MPISLFYEKRQSTLNWLTVPPQSGVAFLIEKNQYLKVSADPFQVADLFCFSKDRPKDALSSGRSIDYNDTISFTTGHVLYSQAGHPLLKITQDTLGKHDFLVTPCSLQMFNMIAGNNDYHPSCYENLCKTLRTFPIDHHLITTTFNIFMNFEILETGKIVLKSPLNKQTDFIIFQAFENLYVGLTACSDPATNAGSCKKIQYAISSLLTELV